MSERAKLERAVLQTVRAWWWRIEIDRSAYDELPDDLYVKSITAAAKTWLEDKKKAKAAAMELGED